MVDKNLNFINRKVLIIYIIFRFGDCSQVGVFEHFGKKSWNKNLLKESIKNINISIGELLYQH